MKQLLREVLLVWMAAHDYLKSGNKTPAMKDVCWPDSPLEWPSHWSILFSLDVASGQKLTNSTETSESQMTRGRKNALVGIMKRIQCLRDILGDYNGTYDQLHMDVFFLAASYDLFSIYRQSALEYRCRELTREMNSWLTKATRNRMTKAPGNSAAFMSADVGVFLIEKAIRHHLKIRFDLSEEVEFDIAAYYRQRIYPDRCLSMDSNSHQLPTAASLRSPRVSEKSENLLDSSHDFDKYSIEIENLKRKLEKQENDLIAQNLDYENELERSLESEKNFRAERTKNAQLQKRQQELIAEVKKSRQTIALQQQEIDRVKTQFNLDSKKFFFPVAEEKIAGGDTTLNQLLFFFNEATKAKKMIRGDDFLMELRRSMVCPSTWRLSTWDSVFYQEESTDDWKLLFAEPSSGKTGVREGFVFAAPHCSVGDVLIKMFDGCLGHSFSARVVRTIRPARVQMKSGNIFSVIPPKGEVSVN